MAPACPPGLAAVARAAAAKPAAKPAAEPAAAPPPPPPATEEDRAAAAALKRAGDEAFVTGRPADAVAAYSGALERTPADPVLLANRAAAHLKRGAHGEALADARRARGLNPTYAKAWYREGAAAAALGAWEDAAVAYFEAHSLEPANATVEAAFKDAIARGRAAHQVAAGGGGKGGA